jgi:hypothetical protein
VEAAVVDGCVAVLEQAVYDIAVAVPRGVQQGRVLEGVSCVWIGPGLQELGDDGRPVAFGCEY